MDEPKRVLEALLMLLCIVAGTAGMGFSQDDARGSGDSPPIQQAPGPLPRKTLALPPPLTAKQKLLYATSDSVTPLAWIEAAGKAGFYQATGFRKKYGGGAAGYGKQFGASVADGVVRNMLGGFVFPALFHQDPRYPRMEHGPFRSRAAYSLSRVFVTRSDSGRRVFNWSSVLSSAGAAGLANTYYPHAYRTVGTTVGNVGWFLLGEAANNLLDEFMPRLYYGLSHHP